MIIKSISVSNFKSFRNMTIELGKLNILIGANASGKSNFIQILKFLKDLARYGLDDAISLQGGVEYFRNVVVGGSEDFKLKTILFLEDEIPNMVLFEEVESINFVYEIRIKFTGKKCKVLEEKIYVDLKCSNDPDARIVISKRGKKSMVDELKIPDGLKLAKIDFDKFLQGSVAPGSLLIQSNFFLILPSLKDIFTNIPVYDFDPKLPKRETSIIARKELEENGENLALVLKNIISDKNSKRKLFNLLTDVLPFLDGVSVEKYSDKSMILTLNETYSKKSIPSFLMSDGTVNIIALIVAMYFEKKTPIVIEEPENGIHPHLIAKVVEMMNDVPAQLIVTTHNPEMVKHADIGDILLVSRDEDGFSTISRPGTKEHLKLFLDNEIGLDELYVQNLL